MLILFGRAEDTAAILFLLQGDNSDPLGFYPHDHNFEYIIFSDSINVTYIAVRDLECYTGQQSDGPRMRENEKYIKLQQKSEHCELTNYNTIIYMRHPTGKLRFTSRHIGTHLKVVAHIFNKCVASLKDQNEAW